MKIKYLLALNLLWTSLSFASSDTPVIKVFDKDSKEQALSSSKDKLLVVLWATWCPDCKVKLKGELNSLKDNNKIELLALNTEKNLKRVQEFIREEDIRVPIAFDKENNFRKELALFTVPAWAVFEKKENGTLKLVDKGSPFDAQKINVALGQAVLN